MNAIEISHLNKRYGDTLAVADLNLRVEEGARLALLGVNGAGKSTTIGMATGLTVPTGGSVRIFGRSPGSREAKALMGLSPQQTAVAPNLTVEENLRFMGEIYGIASPADRTKELMEAFSLTEYAKKRAGKLSGGYERRLSIAMAMVHSPKLLFLDEPTLGLDVLARRELHRLIADLPVTLVLTTHYMEEAEKLARQVAVMHRGRLLAVDTVTGLMEKTGTGSLEDAFIFLTSEAPNPGGRFGREFP